MTAQVAWPVTAENPVRDAFARGQFTYFVELVASATMSEGKIFDIAAQLGKIPEVVAGGITSYAGGSEGHDPIRVAAGARARGLVPNVHLTCVSRDHLDLRNALEDLDAMGLHNVFAITGDYPKSRAGAQPFFAYDSVQLVVQ